MDVSGVPFVLLAGATNNGREMPALGAAYLLLGPVPEQQ